MKLLEWTLIDWDGNPSLKLKCWRKSFGAGHVSVGVGTFLNVVFSFGANSDNSFCATRWNYDNAPIDEKTAMRLVDEQWQRKITNREDFIFPHPARK